MLSVDPDFCMMAGAAHSIMMMGKHSFIFIRFSTAETEPDLTEIRTDSVMMGYIFQTGEHCRTVCILHRISGARDDRLMGVGMHQR